MHGVVSYPRCDVSKTMAGILRTQRRRKYDDYHVFAAFDQFLLFYRGERDTKTFRRIHYVPENSTRSSYSSRLRMAAHQESALPKVAYRWSSIGIQTTGPETHLEYTKPYEAK